MKTLVEAFVERCKERGLNDDQIKEAAAKAASLAPELAEDFEKAGFAPFTKLREAQANHPIINSAVHLAPMLAASIAGAKYPNVAKWANRAHTAIAATDAAGAVATGNPGEGASHALNAAWPHVQMEPWKQMALGTGVNTAGAAVDSLLHKDSEDHFHPVVEDVFSAIGRDTPTIPGTAGRMALGAGGGLAVSKALGLKPVHSSLGGAGLMAGASFGGAAGSPLGILAAHGLGHLFNVKNPKALERLVTFGDRMGKLTGSLAGAAGGAYGMSSLADSIEDNSNKVAVDQGLIRQLLAGIGSNVGKTVSDVGRGIKVPKTEPGVLAGLQRHLSSGLRNASILSRQYPASTGTTLLGGTALAGGLGGAALASLLSGSDKEAGAETIAPKPSPLAKLNNRNRNLTGFAEPPLPAESPIATTHDSAKTKVINKVKGRPPAAPNEEAISTVDVPKSIDAPSEKSKPAESIADVIPVDEKPLDVIPVTHEPEQSMVDKALAYRSAGMNPEYQPTVGRNSRIDNTGIGRGIGYATLAAGTGLGLGALGASHLLSKFQRHGNPQSELEHMQLGNMRRQADESMIQRQQAREIADKQQALRMALATSAPLMR